MQNNPSQGPVQYMMTRAPQMQQQVYAQQAMQQQALAQTPQQDVQQMIQQVMQQQVAGLHGQIQQSVQQSLGNYIAGLQSQIDLLKNGQGRSSSINLQLPYQDIAGLKEYPGLIPFPIPQTKEMLTGAAGTQRYGVDNSTVVATFPTQSAVPYYAVSFRFGLFKTITQGNDLLFAWLPLSAKRMVDFDTTRALYSGLDGQFNIESSGQNLIWQSGDIPSEQADGNERWGYVLPCEVKVAQGETITVSYTPINPAPTANEEYRLFCTMFGYKMVNREALITVADSHRITNAENLQQVQQVQVGNYPTVYTAQ
jgi:hypothetical protein